MKTEMMRDLIRVQNQKNELYKKINKLKQELTGLIEKEEGFEKEFFEKNKDRLKAGSDTIFLFKNNNSQRIQVTASIMKKLYFQVLEEYN